MSMWIFIGIVFVLGEIAISNLVLIWFAISAFILAILANIIQNVFIQIILFGIMSFLLAGFATKKIVKKDKSYVYDTNLQGILLRTGIVKNDIYPNKLGSVLIGGEEWSALSEDNTILYEGDKVKVLKIEGVKLIVKKLNKGE